jgi:PAT family beta-lactamase induction signal transducer AmpG
MSLNKRSPWLYVPTLYFAEGLPYVIVNTVSVILYKKMGMSNEFIGFTSVLYLPWVVKMFWSPLVDVYGTRRQWIIVMQGGLCLLFALLSLMIATPWFVAATLTLFIAMAFAGATNDVATDGYYMLALDRRDQAFFLGVRSTCYRLALICGSGLLVVLAGRIEKTSGSIPLSWSSVMGIAAGIFLALGLLHRWYLPRPAADAAALQQRGGICFGDAFRTYFRQKKILIIIAFILVYRLGESLLLKMAAPFLLDRPDAGGLGLATDTVGFVYGTVGVIGLCAGGLLGGWAIARWGLRRCIWPMAVMLNVPHLLYVYMAAVHPGLGTVYGMVAVEQLGYGFGFSAISVFLMDIAREPYKTSHFAISTGFMALGMMLPGMLSGIIQSAAGYLNFFIIVVVMALPGLLLVPFIPLDGQRD